jgi:hypothetical protein
MVHHPRADHLARRVRLLRRRGLHKIAVAPYLDRGLEHHPGLLFQRHLRKKIFHPIFDWATWVFVWV